MAANPHIVLDDEVRGILGNAQCTGDLLVLNKGLTRDMYVRVNKVLEALGGKWHKGRKGHVFVGDAKVLISAALAEGSVTDKVKLYNYYPTPDAVVDLMLEEVGTEKLQKAERVLEPSAGDGAILSHLNARCPDAVLHACEINPEMHAAVKCKANLVAFDFLAYAPVKKYDLIVANPPFTKGQDVKHVSHMLDLLAKGGALVTVIPEGMLHQSDLATRTLRARLVAECRGFRVVELPEQSFKSAGTNVNTAILCAHK